MININLYNFACSLNKKHWLILLFTFFRISTIFSTPLSLSDSAIYYYESKQFESAAKAYEKIILQGRESWQLHYNLGNAYFKADALGKAIYHYEKARKFNPSQPDLLNNLRIADSKMQDKMEIRENFLEREIRLGIIHFFSLTTWAWLSILGLALCLGFFFLFRVTAKHTLKKIFFWSSFTFSIAFASCLLFGFNALKEKKSHNLGVIITNNVNLYNAPRSEEKKNFQLHEGTRVKIIAQDNDWINIQLQNSNEGWIKITEVGVY